LVIVAIRPDDFLVYPARRQVRRAETARYNGDRGGSMRDFARRFLALTAQFAAELRNDPAPRPAATSFVADSTMDSLDAVEPIVELESEFDVDLYDAAAADLRAVGDAIDYLNRHRKKKRG
jgi:acyl carrier protein